MTSLLLLLSQKLSLLSQLRYRLQVEVRVQVPEQSAGDANLWSVWKLLGSALHGLNGLLVDGDLMEASLDETTGDVLDLFASLDEEVVSGGHAYGNATASVASPDVEARVAGTAVDGEEVEIGVEAGEDSVFRAVFLEVGSSRCEQVRTVSSGVAEVCGWKTEADGSHFRELAYATIYVSNLQYFIEVSKTHDSFMQLPQRSIVGVQRSRRLGASGVILAAFRPGNCVS